MRPLCVGPAYSWRQNLLSMHPLPLRLSPGADLRRALEDAVRAQGLGPAFVLGGIGSLAQARIRFAGLAEETAFNEDLEILSLSGSLSPDGAHLHMAVADAKGQVYGGHAGYGNIIRTTAEILVLPLPDWLLSRELDTATGFKELLVRPRGP